MGEKKSTEIKYLYDEIIKSQNLEKAMYKELETYKTSKEKTLEIVRQINAYVIQRRKLLSKYRTMCYEECGKCEKKEDSDKNIKYTKLEKKVTWGNDIKKLHKKPYKKCKEECNKDNNCVGFTWSNVRNWRRRKCILKNKIGKIRNEKRWTLFQKNIEDDDEDGVDEAGLLVLYEKAQAARVKRKADKSGGSDNSGGSKRSKAKVEVEYEYEEAPKNKNQKQEV